jgi:hypothetical protein
MREHVMEHKNKIMSTRAIRGAFGASLALCAVIGCGAPQAPHEASAAVVASGEIDRTVLPIHEPERPTYSELDARNVKYGRSTIEDYAAEGSSEGMWSGYHGKQHGDPAKLGDALVKIAGMDNPPKQFLAGSDALAVVKPILEGRLEELRAYESLSKTTDGFF